MLLISEVVRCFSVGWAVPALLNLSRHQLDFGAPRLSYVHPWDEGRCEPVGRTRLTGAGPGTDDE